MEPGIPISENLLISVVAPVLIMKPKILLVLTSHKIYILIPNLLLFDEIYCLKQSRPFHNSKLSSKHKS